MVPNTPKGAARFLTRMSWTRDDAITILHVIFAIPFHEDEKFHFNTLQAIKKECAPRISLFGRSYPQNR